MPMDNVTLENTQQSISSRDTKSVASVMVNGKWVNLSDTLEQANVKSDVGTVSKQVAEQQEVVTSAVAQADSAVAYANDAIEKSRVNSQAIVEINSAVSDAVSGAAVARSDGLRAWNAAQSNADLIDSNYASASAAISSARTEAIAAANEAKASASAAQADIVAVRSDVAAVQADVTANKSDVVVARSDIAVAKTDLASQATSLSSYVAQASAAGEDITTLKSQAGHFEQEMADTKGDVSQLKISASSASAALSDAAGNISSLQVSAKSYSAALSDAKGDIATVKATASELETKYADAAGDISQIKTDAKGMTQTISDAQGDIAKLKTRADGFDTQFADINGNINKLQTDATGTKQTLTNAKSDIAVLQSRADGFDTKYADAAGDINTLKADASGFSQTLTDAKGDISTLQSTATGFKNTLTDAQGNISTLQSDVAGLKRTTSDHAGDIATLQADAKTLTSQMSSAQGDISTLKQTASGIDSRVSGVETSLADANTKITANSTAIEQNKNAIALKADQTDVDTVKGTVAGLQSSLTVQGNQIQTKVSASDVSGMLKGYATQDYTQSLVTQQANTLSSTITTVKNQVNSLESTIDWTTKTGSLDMDTLTTTQNIYYRDTNLKNADGEAGWAYIQVVSMGERVTQTVWHDRSSIQHTRTGAVSGSSYNWDAWNRTATNAQISNLTQSLDGLRSTVATKADQSEVTQLSNLVQSKVSSGDFTSTTTQLKNMINQRVQVGDVISQINQEAGGDTLIQVSNGKKSLILDAGNTIITGKAWIPSAAIANLTADQVQAGTLSGSKVHAGDNSGNGIDMGALSTNYVGFHAYANNGDNTFIDLNGIHNYGASYDTRIQQGKITTNYLAVNGGGMIDFRNSDGTGMVADGSTLTFDVSNTPAGYLSYNGMPVAEIPDGSGGNELAIRYGLSAAIIPEDSNGAQATFSKSAQKIAYMTGTDQGKQMLSGLEVHSNNHHWLCAVNSDATCNRFEVNDRNGLNIAWHDNTHFFISDGNAKLYKDTDDSPTATKLEVHGWAWVNGWVEAAGHSQHSALSTKTDIQSVDDDKMLKMVNDTDLTTFLYKTDVANGETHHHIGPIIDDVHDVAQYQTPQDFIAPNGVSRDDDNMIGALFGAVKALTKRIKTLESKVG
ncbi:hypothetical protein HCZ92_07695 [Limosilactobacillus fermentum]